MARVKENEIKVQFWAVKYYKNKDYAKTIKQLLASLGTQKDYKFSITGIVYPNLSVIVAKSLGKDAAIVELDKFIKVLDEMDEECKKDIMTR